MVKMYDFAEIKKFVKFSAPVNIRLRKYLIERIKFYYDSNPNILVQIDETKLNHNVKSHIGARTNKTSLVRIKFIINAPECMH